MLSDDGSILNETFLVFYFTIHTDSEMKDYQRIDIRVVDGEFLDLLLQDDIWSNNDSVAEIQQYTARGCTFNLEKNIWP